MNTLVAALCLPYPVIVQGLHKEHGERPIARGLDNSGVVVEVFSAPNGNWTIVVTKPNGESCMMAAGVHWENTSSGTKENGT